MRNKEFQRNKSERNTWYYVNHPTEPLVSNMLQHVVNMLQHVVNMLQHDDATITIYNSGQLLTFLKGTVHSQRTKWSKI